MSGLKGLLDRARTLAHDHLPTQVLDAGRRLRDVVVERVGGPDEPVSEPGRDDDTEAVLRRVKAKADRGLKPEDRLVVVYATDAEADAVAEITRCFAGIETTVRVMDLDREPPQTKRQLAALTDVMVPPYVYINGRYWGGQYEIVTLAADGELEHVVANLLDELSPEARRLGKLHDSYSDDITEANIVARWRLGHILCVDDLDAWYEDGREGPRFYYQGGQQPVERMPAIAAEIAAAVAAGTSEAHWMLDPVVHMP